MYGTAGDFVGRSLAQLIIGGLTTPPKVQINVRGLALNWLINPEIRDDMLQSVSMFAQQGIALARNVLIRFALLKGRHAGILESCSTCLQKDNNKCLEGC